MQRNRKLYYMYGCEARRGVPFSRALLNDGNSLSRPQPKAVLSPVSYRSSRRRRQRKRLLLKVPIITRLKRHFSNHGIPNLFQSDNGPPFDSQEFRDFAAAYEFELVTSSPNYPQSNGRVENAVKTAKQRRNPSKQEPIFI